jgi:hypothetical protein
MSVKRGRGALISQLTAAGKLTDRSASRAYGVAKIAVPLIVGLASLAFSAVPALAEPVEAPVTEEAKEITGTTATLHGELNPNASATTSYDFEYSPYGYCEVFPTKPEGPVTGEKLKVSAHVTELEAHTVYTFCAVALNGTDEPAFYGPGLTFETLASTPVIPGESATNINAKDATFEGSVNPENRVTTYRFEYGTEAAKLGTAEATTVGESSIPAVGEAQPAGPVDLDAVLRPSTTYFYRVVASNVTGVTDGKIEEFTTPPLQAPAIEGESVTGVTQTGAELHATINPEFQPVTSCTFDFSGGIKPLSGSPAQCAPSAAQLGDGGSGVGTGTVATGLEPNTEYDYKVLTKNGIGEAEVAGESFLTLPGPPTVSTVGASSITAATESVAGTVNPGANGHLAEDDTTYYVEYGGTTAYGKQTPFPSGEAVEACRLLEIEGKACPQGVAIVGEGTSTKAETLTLSGLEPGRTYHYRVVATNLNDAGALNEPPTASVYGEHLKPQTVYGQDATFETPSTPPIISGTSVSNITQSSATITATLESQGLPTRWELQVGATQDQLQLIASGQTSSATELSLPVGSLAPGTTYYYKLTATNPDGTIEPEGSFTTAPGSAAAASSSLSAVIPYQSIAELNAKEAKEDRGLPSPVVTKTLTNAEKLKKALKVCKKDRSKTKRAACEAKAHKEYGPVKKAKRGKK